MALDKVVTTQTVPAGYNRARPDFNKSDFEIALYQKGYTVIHEKALKCPCKGKGEGGQLSSCKNCGGTGWIFINSKETRMVMHSMNQTTAYKDWSEENRGTCSITCSNIEELAFMDRLTLSEVHTIYNENLYAKVSGDDLLFFTTYPIEEILYIGLYKGNTVALQKLEETADYEFDRNIITLNSSFDSLGNDLTLTIRYKHNPQYHVIDIPRHTMSTKVDTGGVEESPVTMPIHAIGRYAHFVLDMENLVGDRIIDNSYTEDHC